MKRSSLISFLSASCFLSALMLAGCSGMTSSFPDTPAEVPMGAMQGSVFGGHSPIIGSEIYVFQTGNSYNGAVLNKLTAGDAQGTDATHGAYVLSFTGGLFSLGGDYTCTAGQPVYLASVGGTTAVGATVIHITAASHAGSVTTFTAATPPATGNPVSFASGAFTTASGYSALNGTTQSVTGNPASGTFTISFTPTKGTSTTGYALIGGLPNPAINNIAVAGICASPATFATNLPFIYMSEESTVAAAYALSGFGTGPFTIGAPNSNINGITAAANTAGQLYNITKGGNAVSSTHAGLNDQINGTTSTGTVPELELNTLANILAACVDSGGTASSPSSICTTLFSNATSNGVANGGTVPTDIATAAFNIAQHPASNVAALYPIQNAGSAPFAPNLSSAPKDFTVTIAYSGGGLGVTSGQSPHSVAVDSNGNIYTANYSENSLSVFSALGVPQSTSGYTGNELSGPVSIAVDTNTPATVWLANNGDNYLSHFDATGAADAIPTYNFGAGSYLLRDAQFDQNGNLWVTADNPHTLYEVTENRSGTAYQAAQVSTLLSSPYGVSVDQYGDVWVANSNAKEATVCEPNFFGNYGCSNETSGGIAYATGNAIDYNNNVWFGNSNGTVSAFDDNGNSLTNSPYSTGSGTLIDGIAMDGSDNVWATNTAGDALFEFSYAYVTHRGTNTYTITEITPTSGYTASSPDGIAIDGSGNVWYNSSSTPNLYQVVGAATPVVTPISNGILNGTQGSEP